MGITWSYIQTIEHERWELPHHTMVDSTDNSAFLYQVEFLKSPLKLCRRPSLSRDVLYNHFFITDDTRVIEFGNGDPLSDHNKVSIYQKAKERGVIVKQFDLDVMVKFRLSQILGMTNFSLALRNSEHVAYFIYCGSWICGDMLPNGRLHNLLGINSRFSPDKALINKCPDELQLRLKPAPIFEGREGFLTWTNNDAAVLTDDATNVLILGPTGCGKSSIINNLFNMTVCKKGSSARSET